MKLGENVSSSCVVGQTLGSKQEYQSSNPDDDRNFPRILLKFFIEN